MKWCGSFVLLIALLVAITAATTVFANDGKNDGKSESGESATKFKPGELIVRFRPGADAAARSAARGEVGLRVKNSLALPRTQLVSLPAGADVESAIEALERDPAVEFAEPNLLVKNAAYPADPLYPGQWPLNNTGTQVSPSYPDADIDAPEAWDTTTGNSSVKIAVVDNGGVDYTHEDLAANMWTNSSESGANASNQQDDDGNGKADDARGWDYVDDDGYPLPTGDPHGTQAAGVIAAAANNTRGGVGVMWNATVIPVRIDGTLATLIDGIDYAARSGATIINMSLALDGASVALREEVSLHPDVMMVASAGNDGGNRDDTTKFNQLDPCSAPGRNVICVAATDARDELHDYSGYGVQSVDVAAPVGTWTTLPGNQYGGFGGTSEAAPVAAGVLGLLKAFRPQATGGELRAALLAGVDEQTELYSTIQSRGRVNAQKSLAAIGVATGQVSASVNVNSLVVTSAPGVANQLTITESVGTSSVSDASATVVAGQGCTQSGATAICDTSSVSTARVLAGDGNDAVTVNGAIGGELFGGSGNDTLIGGDLTDYLIGGVGADIMSGRTGTSDLADYTDHSVGVTVTMNDDNANDGATGLNEGDNVRPDVEVLLATGANDFITGSDSTNLIDAGSGVNTINAKGGNDVMRAGFYNDTFNGGDGADVVDYSNHLLHGITATLGTASGNGAWTTAESDAINADVEGLTGGPMDDTLTGNSGGGAFNGGLGNDMIDPGLGADSVNGGRGIDTVTYATRSSGVTVTLTNTVGDGESGGTENDNIQDSVERVIGTSFGDSLTGGAAPNIFVGGTGTDVFVGGSGRDTVDYSDHSAVTLSNNGAAASGTTGGNENDTIAADIETMIGSAGVDTLIGQGNGDKLVGGAGNDTLNGGAGDDVLEGGDGTDAFDGGSGSDVVSYADADTWEPVTASINGSGGDGRSGENEYLNPTTIEGLVGGLASDNLTLGSTGGVLDGGTSGQDVLNGNTGNDRLVGDTPDTAVIDSVGQATCAATAWDFDTLNGGGGSDVLMGGLAADTINGGDGDDTLYGANDGSATTALGEAVCIGSVTGARAGVEDNAGDQYNGGAGNDTVSYQAYAVSPTNVSPPNTGVTVTIDDNANDGGVGFGTEGDNVHKDVENVTGTKFNDTIAGSEFNNTLRGGLGDDSLTAGDGNDVLFGEAGSDTLRTAGDGVADTSQCGDGPSDAAYGDLVDTLDVDCEFRNTVSAINTIIDSQPSSSTLDNTPTVEFHASLAPATFECKQDTGVYVSCSSPHTTPVLADGPHTITVRALDSNGTPDSTPAVISFTVDSVAPDTVIDSGPADGSTVTTSTSQFSFHASESGSTFECRVDGGSYSTCTSSFTTPALTDGLHVVSIRAVDAAFNIDASPASRSFTVESTTTGSITVGSPATTSTPIDLSALGPVDWAHWGRGGVSGFDRRDTAASDRISNYELANGGTPTAASFTSPIYNWSNGTAPNATGSTGTGIYVGGAQNRGFNINVPAVSSQARVLKLFVGVQNTTGQLTLSMSDGSATTIAPTVTASSTLLHRVYTVSYRSKSATAMLQASWKQTTTSSSGRAYLESAAIAADSDTTAAETSITSGPVEDGVTNTATSTFGLGIVGDTASTVPGFLCKLDVATSYTPCPASYTTTALAEGRHTLSVRSVDQHGNVDPTPVVRNFWVSIPVGALSKGLASSTPSTVNLSTVGTYGWAHWGTTSSISQTTLLTPTRTAGLATSIFPVASKLPSGTTVSVSRVTSSIPSYSWTNGPTGSPAANAISIGGASGRGIQFNVAANAANQRTAMLYIGVQNTTAKLSLALSDGSAPTIVDTTSFTGGSTIAHYVVPVTYRAASTSSPYLTTQLTQNVSGSTGKVFLESVALTENADATAPVTSFISGPADGSTISGTTATFGFTTGETPTPTQQCQVDSGAFANCTSTFTTPVLSPGTHAFSVRAVDAAGNIEQRPPRRTFIVP